MTKRVIPSPSGPEAVALRRRARRLLARFHLPDDALPGSLALSRRRCGKPSCHCAGGEGHALWTLTFMAGGKKRVETFPRIGSMRFVPAWKPADTSRKRLPNCCGSTPSFWCSLGSSASVHPAVPFHHRP